ncbi:ABC transporter substrate-binding protein [Massilia sp. TS11]|uniref:substrate-binding periplasmic protein n=1 Tax=Massilia sp. TS11 TaxID=2908003 RepID=UPI001ED9E577|nr:transporter substrate-binding domain-containing protein [Massilia sp. TS11]MCG2583164.1 transporter substrate-binding domain-containing protein [Massilia sp. TS11]
MLRRKILTAAAGLAFPALRSARAAQLIHYPRPEQNDHPWQHKGLEHYPVRLLEMALGRSSRHYLAQPVPFMMTQGRATLELQAGRQVDLMWTMSSRQREQDLLPIRIPIYKGLIGWRLLLVRAADRARFAQVRNIDALRGLTFLQGHDWPDADILRANGLRVQPSSDYGGMFKMLATGRVDVFPRSVIEIWNEAEANASLGLVVEPHLVLRYPSAFYYFVNKANTALADDLRAGLESMLADGSFDRLFREYHEPLLRQARLPARRVIDLVNPLLPSATPLERRELWFRT